MVRSIAARPLREAEGVGGEPVLTDFVFLSYMRWIAERAEFRGRVFSVAEKGLEIPGIGRASVEEAMEASRPVKGPATPRRPRRPPPPPAGAPVFAKTSAFLFFKSLEEEAGNALREVETLPRPKPGWGAVSRYPFLAPILAEAGSLYREPEAVAARLSSFLAAFGEWVKRARDRVSRGVPRS
jgi:hypothetical protein